MNENLAYETIPLATAMRRRDVPVAALERVSLFVGLDRARLAELARRARRQRFRERSVVVQEGSEASSIYVIVSGQVRVFASEDTRQITLGRRGPDSTFTPTPAPLRTASNGCSGRFRKPSVKRATRISSEKTRVCLTIPGR